MALAHLKAQLKENPKLKKLAHDLLFSKNARRPRWWVRHLLNPFIHKKGKNALVRRRARLDIVPYNTFYVGQNSVIEDYAVISNGVGPVTIGDNSFVGLHNIIIGPVTIGNHVIIAQHVVLSGLNHSYEAIDVPVNDQPHITKEIIIEDECWIGANAVITAGVTIGRHAVVAAGSIVTKNVPAYSVVAGNPARLLKQYNPVSGQWEKVTHHLV